MIEQPFVPSAVRRLGARLIIDALATGDTQFLTGRLGRRILDGLDLGNLDILELADQVRSGCKSTRRGQAKSG